jgi:hypothetical protein
MHDLTMHDKALHDMTLHELTHLLAVDVDAVGGCRGPSREPALGVLVVERPRWNDDEEGEGGAGEANVQGQGNVLLGEADEEGDDLEGMNISYRLWGGDRRGQRTPAAPRSTVVSISARRWPSKSWAR